MAVAKAMQPFNQDDQESPIEVNVVPDGTDVPPPEQPAPPPMPQHRDNLAEFLEDNELNGIANELLPLYEADLETRRDWIEAYTKGLDYLGFSMEDRTKPFKGASGVFHPLLSEAVVRFQSNAIMEIFPAAGPVLTKVLGDETPDKMHQAQRVKEELNYQLTENMAEYRNETEQLLFRLPLAGSVFRKVYFDPMKDRCCAMMVPAEDFVVDYNSSELEDCERFTHRMKRSTNEVKKLMRSGFYRTVSLPAPQPEHKDGKEKEDELSGRQPSLEKDTARTLLEMHVHYNLPGPFADPDDIADPYIITIDRTSKQVLSIYRNWAPDDNQTRKAECYFVHYQYMPGLGFYGIGLIHLLGSTAKGATSILRQVIDAGTLSNLPGGLKTRGLRTKGMDEPVQPGEWRDIDVPAGSLKENLFPMPYKEPSASLINLLTMLVDEGRRIGSIADLQVGSMTENAPVGTTLALMERSLKVMSAVHARLHASLRRELKYLVRCIADYMTPKYDWDLKGEFNRQQDFDGRVDVLPVSDPNAATQAQKIIQLQAVQQLAQANPELYNLKELHREALQAIGIKNDERILPVDKPPPRLDPIQENMAVLTGQPIKVYMDQDHTAHIQAHLSWASDPKINELVGQSPNAGRIQGAMESHIAEHLAFQYRAEMEQEMGVKLPPVGQELPPEVEAALSRMVAAAAAKLRQKHDDMAKLKMAEQLANDPQTMVKMRELDLKEREFDHKREKDSIDMWMDATKQASKEILDTRKIDSQEQMKGAEIGANLVTFGAKLDADQRREGVKLGKEIAADLRADNKEAAKMQREAVDKAAERESKIEIARIAAASRSKPQPKKGE